MKKTVYTGQAVRNTIERLTAAGATAGHFTGPDGVNREIITKAGYKTLVFTYYGFNEDGTSLYTLRKYNRTPQKYTIGG